MSEKKISIRIGVADGDKARKEMRLTGEVGEKAMRRIKEATAPASKGLAAINVIAQQSHFAMMHLASGAGTLGINLSRLGPAGMGFAALLGGISLAMQKGLREFMEAEHALNQLNAALKTTDFASGITAENVLHLGEALERATLFKKEDVVRAATSLTSFGSLHGKVFQRALALSADLAVRLGTDVPYAADTLARVLEKPEDGLGRLSRSFGNLSFAQKEAIRNFIEQGDIMSAQMVIIDHLKLKVDGLAKAQATGLTGATNALSDAASNLWQSLVKVVGGAKIAQVALGGVTDALVGLRRAIDPTLVELRESLRAELEELDKAESQQVHTKLTGYSRLRARKRAQLAEVEAKMAQRQRQETAKEEDAKTAAAEAVINTRNDRLLELQKKYLKEQADITASAQQKILTEYANSRREIEGLGKQGASDKFMQGALSSLHEATTLKLASIPGLRTGQQARESYEAQKKALDDWRANLERNLNSAGAKNEEYANQIEQIYNVRLKEIYAKSLADSTHWADGAQRALMSYAEAATNAAANAEKVFSAAANKAEDVLTNAVMKGKLSFDSLRDFALSTLDDITRAMVRQNITGPLASGLGGMFSGMFSGGLFGIFHEGGVVGKSEVPFRFMPIPSPREFLANTPRFHSGLAPDEFPAILQKGETVLPKHAHFRAVHGQGDGAVNIVFNVTTPNVQSFTESRGQIMAMLAGEMDRFRQRNR